MASDNSQPATLHGQIDTLAMQAGKLRDAFQKKKPRDLPANTIEDLNNLSDTLAGSAIKSENSKQSKAIHWHWPKLEGWSILRLNSMKCCGSLWTTLCASRMPSVVS